MILALSMVLSILPVSAFADAGVASAANKDGETIYEENSNDELYSLFVQGEETKHKEGELIELTAEDQPGFDFVGWQGFMGVPDGVDLTQKTIRFNMPAKIVMLVKNYQPKAPEKYTLTVNGDPELHAVGDPIEKTAPDKDGFTFNHWEATGLTSDVDINSVTIRFSMPDHNVTLISKYDEKPVKKFFVYVDGGETKEYAVGDPVEIPAPAPKKEGYAFTRWESSDVPADTDLTKETIKFEMPDHDVTLTPQYEMSQYTLTVNGKDGRVEKHPMGDLINVSAPAAEDGYTFTGWKVEGKLPDGTDTSSAKFSFRMPANNVTLTPQYAKKYSVSLNSVKQGSYFEGDDVTIEAKQPGLTFAGWVDTEDLPTDAKIDGATITFKMPAHDVKLTAEFKDPTPDPVPTTTFALKVNKAQATLQNGAAVDLTAVPVGAKLVVTADADTDTSVFKKWNCTGLELTEEQSTARELKFDMPDQDVELTAVFEAPATPDPEPTPDPKPNPDPEPTPDPDPAPAPSDDGSAAVIMAATAVGGAAVGVGAYMVGTTVYLKSVLPESMAIPANRQQLAVALWTAAGKPATQSTALFNDVAADAAELQAIRWAVDTGLMTAQDGNFNPGSRVSRLEVIRTWKNYQKRG